MQHVRSCWTVIFENRYIIFAVAFYNSHISCRSSSECEVVQLFVVSSVTFFIQKLCFHILNNPREETKLDVWREVLAKARDENVKSEEQEECLGCCLIIIKEETWKWEEYK